MAQIVKTKETSLTTGEQAKLAQCEAVIDKGMESFVAVGAALITIRDENLYIEVGETFEDYCRTRWKLPKSRCYELMDAARVVQNIGVENGKSEISDSVPSTESHARALKDVPEEKQAETWRQAVSTAPKGGDGKPKVTATHVKAVADKATPQPKRDTLKCVTGASTVTAAWLFDDTVATFIARTVGRSW